MAADDVVEAKVVFTTKELLQRIDRRFDNIEQLLHGVAMKTDLEALTARVAALEADAVETKAVAEALLREKDKHFTKREKVLGMAFAIVTILLNIFSLSAGPHWFS